MMKMKGMLEEFKRGPNDSEFEAMKKRLEKSILALQETGNEMERPQGVSLFGPNAFDFVYESIVCPPSFIIIIIIIIFICLLLLFYIIIFIVIHLNLIFNLFNPLLLFNIIIIIIIIIIIQLKLMHQI